MDNELERSINAQLRYKLAAHAMQTGVAFTMDADPDETSPKHLRIGVNAALVDAGSLGALLIKKGVITEVEYFESLADIMEKEVESYTKKLEKLTGKKVTLA